jgi:hypothetical protein
MVAANAKYCGGGMSAGEAFLFSFLALPDVRRDVSKVKAWESSAVRKA